MALCLSLCGLLRPDQQPGGHSLGGPRRLRDAPAASEAPGQRKLTGPGPPSVDVQGVMTAPSTSATPPLPPRSYAPVGVPFNARTRGSYKAYNDNGGFQGKSIELITMTTASRRRSGPHLHQDPGPGAETKVFAIVGHFGTNTVAATRSIT